MAPHTPRSHRRAHLKHRYGITVERWDELFAEQGGRCAICRVEHGDAAGRRLGYDDGDAPGLLCQRCRMGVAILRVVGVEPVLAYLTRQPAHPTSTAP